MRNRQVMVRGISLVCVVLVLGAMFFGGLDAFAAGKQFVVASSEANMRKAADVESAKVATLKKGTRVTVTGSSAKWYKVSFDGKKGYIAKELLKPASQSAAKKTKTTASASKSAKTLSSGSSGQAVLSLQKRLVKLGYLSSSAAKGTYNSATVKAIKHFQMQAGLGINGKASAETQKKLNSSGAPRKKSIVTMDWFKSNINSAFSRSSTATIIDCSTGTRIKIRRIYGTNHADVEPATAKDTEKLKSIYGGTWSWNARAVILVVGGKYVAASINGMPHGGEISKTNNFNGQFCLHTTGSKTHGTDCVNSSHQSKVKTAAKYLK